MRSGPDVVDHAGGFDPRLAFADPLVIDGGAAHTIEAPETADNVKVGDTGTGTLPSKPTAR